MSFLAALADTGPALAFGIGTGRIAVPLSQRGIRVDGIELSPTMVEQLRLDPGASHITVTVGDFATAVTDQRYRLVYLLRNTITNLTTQDEQVACFRNAAAHLAPGGCFVIENYIPSLQRLPLERRCSTFIATPTHVGVEEYDMVRQIAVPRHYWEIDGQLREFSSRIATSGHRADLMAQLAGMTLQGRWNDWERGPFTSERRGRISVWQT